MLLQCRIERVESVVWLSQRQPGPAVRCPARGRGHPGRGLREPLSSQLLDAVIDVSLSAHRWQGAERHLDALAAYTAQEAFPWADFLIRRGRALISAGQGLGSAGRAPVCARCACSQKRRVRPD